MREHRGLYTMWVVIVILILSPSIFFPNSIDLNIFSHAADVILSGGKMYRDFIDIKPPLLYNYFALLRFVVGSSEFALHLADAVVQLVSLFVCSIFLFRATANLPLSLLSTALYALCYAALGQASVMQAESIALLPIAIILCVQVRDVSESPWRIGATIGVCVAILMSLKLSLVIILFAIFLSDIPLMSTSRPVVLRKWLSMTLAMLLSLLLLWSSFADVEVREAFSILVDYIKAYSAYPAVDSRFLLTAWRSWAVFFGDQFTVGMSMLCLAGLSLLLFRSQTTSMRRLTLVSFLVLFVFAVSIVVERKFHPYHFVRLFFPLCVFAAYALLELKNKVADYEFKSTNGIVLSGLIVFGLVMSPLARWFNLLHPAFLYLGNRAAYDEYYEKSAVPGMERVQQQRCAEIILERRREGEKTLVVAVDALRINALIHETHWSKFAGSQFYYAAQAPKPWMKAFHDEFQQADWLVVATKSRYPYVNLHGMTALESLQSDTIVAKSFAIDFEFVDSTRTLNVYHRRVQN